MDGSVATVSLRRFAQDRKTLGNNKTTEDTW